MLPKSTNSGLTPMGISLGRKAKLTRNGLQGFSADVSCSAKAAVGNSTNTGLLDSKSGHTMEPLARNPLRQLATYIGNDYHSARCVHPEMNPAREDSIEASVPVEKFLLTGHIVVYPT